MEALSQDKHVASLKAIMPQQYSVMHKNQMSIFQKNR